MKTPSGPFVLFQFCGSHAGQVMFRPGRKAGSVEHFVGLVGDLERKLSANNHDHSLNHDLHKYPRIDRGSFVRYRTEPPWLDTWTNIPEDELSDLCRDFSDSLAGARG